jgi:CDP-6-deoxy-D-xylo-4-hexulose-3-dehydrase
VVGSLTNTDSVMTSSFFVGCYPGIGKPQIDYMLEIFAAFFKSR